MSKIATSDGYRTLQEWLREVTPKGLILCKRSALLMHGMISGDFSEDSICVYKPHDFLESIPDNVHEEEFPREKISVVEKGGVLCTTEEQTFKDMLCHGEEDDESLAEAIADYYYSHGRTFPKLLLDEKSARLYEEYKEWALEFYRIH